MFTILASVLFPTLHSNTLETALVTALVTVPSGNKYSCKYGKEMKFL